MLQVVPDNRPFRRQALFRVRRMIIGLVLLVTLDVSLANRHERVEIDITMPDQSDAVGQTVCTTYIIDCACEKNVQEECNKNVWRAIGEPQACVRCANPIATL